MSSGTQAEVGEDLSPIPLGHGGTPRDVQYYSYACAKCGKEGRNTYSEPYRTDMLKHRLRWTCNFWREFSETTDPVRLTIIGGRVYTPGTRREGSFLGMAGRRFDIEYIEPSVYAGQRCTTFDLWSGSDIPTELRRRYPDTARFLGGAQECKVGDITCWNPSHRLAPEYPSPSALKVGGTR